jgi:tRNA 2-thiouridine synthesizing protein A
LNGSDGEVDYRELLLRVAAARGTRCRACGGELCGHARLFDIVIGFQDDPRCPECLAKTLGRPRDVLIVHLRDYVNHRDCTRRAWEEISSSEPRCRLADPQPAVSPPPDVPLPAGTAGPPLEPDAAWDAGDLGCGDLVLALRARLRALPPRGCLHLRALDPGAPEDIPAWCALTGHRLVHARHPDYYIRRKDD